MKGQKQGGRMDRWQLVRNKEFSWAVICQSGHKPLSDDGHARAADQAAMSVRM